ncbi:hypothetical protein ED733_005981 [Metarhizium rileyi]|uniref:Uncharacterized protein n=1 Tax=Metarhizium rileyi (strain RCEF 4871) TaxID=1649241 RepID=A0A5C6GIV1_METRR|nr:hypothetical protein ED733_005981 [Metarhizium rileyi]
MSLKSTDALSERQSRVVDALLALHAGDSLDDSVKFESHALVHARYPHGLRDIIGGGPCHWAVGQATDDTDMTRGLFQPDLDKLVKESLRISKITHDDERFTISCAVYNRIVAALIRGSIPESALKLYGADGWQMTPLSSFTEDRAEEDEPPLLTIVEPSGAFELARQFY